MPRTGAADRFLVVLDYDGTLCATRGAIVDAIMRIFDLHRIARPDDERIAAIVGTGAALPEVVRLVHPAGHALTDDEVDCWTREYRQLYAEHSAASVRAFPGVRETLERLAGNVDIVVMSNKGAEAVNASLEALGLRAFIDAVIADENDQARKPNPRVFTERIVRHFAGARPGRTLVVGDTEVDLLFAKNARLKSCWAEYGYGCPIRCGEVGFDYRIAAFAEVAEVLADVL